MHPSRTPNASLVVFVHAIMALVAVASGPAGMCRSVCFECGSFFSRVCLSGVCLMYSQVKRRLHALCGLYHLLPPTLPSHRVPVHDRLIHICYVSWFWVGCFMCACSPSERCCWDGCQRRNCNSAATWTAPPTQAFGVVGMHQATTQGMPQWILAACSKRVLQPGLNVPLVMALSLPVRCWCPFTMGFCPSSLVLRYSDVQPCLLGTVEVCCEFETVIPIISCETELTPACRLVLMSSNSVGSRNTCMSEPSVGTAVVAS